MSGDLRSIIHTQHPHLAIEVKQAINAMQKVLELAGPLPATGLVDISDSKASGIYQTLDTAPIGIGETTDGGTGHDGPLLKRHLQAAAPALVAGEAFGRYQINKLLGKGAMGAVYLAYDPRLDRYVAIKIPFFRDSQTALERFYIEARATATLRSHQICPIYDVAQINGVHYISMAFIEGKPLTEMIKAAPLSPSKAAAIVGKVARGIQKAHERGVVHRDLKPDNIMIDQDGEPVVMDFGLAIRNSRDDARLTSDGTLLGSPAYMSPEQAQGKSDLIGPSADIYSLGVVLYQMITTKLPFSGSVVSVLQRIVNEAPARPATHVPALANSPIESICLKMMEKSPSNRYPCMGDVAEAMEDYLSNGASENGPQARRRFSFWPFNRS